MKSLPTDLTGYWDHPRLATLSTVRPDGTPHAVPVKPTVDNGIARVLTRRGTVKINNVLHHPYAALTEHTRATWATVEGPATVSTEPEEIALAHKLYTRRFQADEHWADCVILVRIDRILHGSR